MNWWTQFKIKWAKKILNKYAPKGEFIAYINKLEERYLKNLGGYGKPVNKTGIKSFWPSFVDSAIDWATSTVTKFAPVAKFFKKWAPWLSYINIGISIIYWLKKPNAPDTPIAGAPLITNVLIASAT